MIRYALYGAGSILTALAFSIASVGGYLNYEGALFMVPGKAAQAVAMAAAASEFVKAFWIAGLGMAIASRQYGAAFGCTVLGLMLHGFSLLCAIGVTSADRAVAIDTRADTQQQKQRAEQAYSNAKARLEMLRGKRPSLDVRKDVEEAGDEVRQYDERRKSQDCKARCRQEAIEKGDAARVKAKSLNEELKLSLQAEEAQADLAKTRTALDQTRAPSVTDPQAAALAAYLPVDAGLISKGMPLAPSLLIEFVPVLILGSLSSVFFSAAGRQNRRVSVDKAKDDSRHQEQTLLADLETMLKAQGGKMRVSQRALAETLGVPKSTLADALKKLSADGKLKVESASNHTLLSIPS